MIALRSRFSAQFGVPHWTVLHGQSMGGHVTIASLELHPEIYQGGLIECGIVDGVSLVDWLYAYTAAASHSPDNNSAHEGSGDFFSSATGASVATVTL
jgi:hypothetical protein